MRIILIVLLAIGIAPAANGEGCYSADPTNPPAIARHGGEPRYFDRSNQPACHSETRGSEARFFDRHSRSTGHKTRSPEDPDNIIGRLQPGESMFLFRS